MTTVNTSNSNDDANLSWQIGSHSFERRQSSNTSQKVQKNNTAKMDQSSRSDQVRTITKSMSCEEEQTTSSTDSNHENELTMRYREPSNSEDWENAQVAFPQNPPSPPRRNHPPPPSTTATATNDSFDNNADSYIQLSVQPTSSVSIVDESIRHKNTNNGIKTTVPIVIPDINNDDTVDVEACTGTTLSIATNASGWAVYHPSEFRSWFDKIHSTNNGEHRGDSTHHKSSKTNNNKSIKKVRKSRSHYSDRTRSSEITAACSEYDDDNDGMSSYYTDYLEDDKRLLRHQSKPPKQPRQPKKRQEKEEQKQQRCTYTNIIIICSIILSILLGCMGGYIAYTFFHVGGGDNSDMGVDNVPETATTTTPAFPPSTTPDISQQEGDINTPMTVPTTSPPNPKDSDLDHSEDVTSDINNNLYNAEQDQSTNHDEEEDNHKENEKNDDTDTHMSNVDFSNTDYTVGVYYYPWYTQENDFHGQNYLRGELDPPQYPTLGEYNQDDPNTIAQHLKWSQQANINLWVTSWWGPDEITDQTTQKILNHKDLPKSNIKIALFYETRGRVSSDGDISNIYPDMDYIAQTYFGNPNYLEIQGRPVIYVYLARWLHLLDKLEVALVDMRSAAKANGYDDIYIVGDLAHGAPPDSHFDRTYEAFQWLDAITEFDIFGSMGRAEYAGNEGVELYRTSQEKWSDAAHHESCDFIPSITPGFNDKGVRTSDVSSMSRKIRSDAEFGSLFETMLTNALGQVDTNTGNLFMVNSFNQWHEDTQIEPVTGSLTSVPQNHTNGKAYEAYGTRYLDILHDGTQR